MNKKIVGKEELEKIQIEKYIKSRYKKDKYTTYVDNRYSIVEDCIVVLERNCTKYLLDKGHKLLDIEDDGKVMTLLYYFADDETLETDILKYYDTHFDAIDDLPRRMLYSSSKNLFSHDDVKLLKTMVLMRIEEDNYYEKDIDNLIQLVLKLN